MPLSGADPSVSRAHAGIVPSATCADFRLQHSRALGTARHMSVCCVVHALRAGRGLPVGLSPNLHGKWVFIYGIRLLRTHSLRRTLHDRVREDDFHYTYIPGGGLGAKLGGGPPVFAHFRASVKISEDPTIGFSTPMTKTKHAPGDCLRTLDRIEEAPKQN